VATPAHPWQQCSRAGGRPGLCTMEWPWGVLLPLPRSIYTAPEDAEFFGGEGVATHCHTLLPINDWESVMKLSFWEHSSVSGVDR
jgi:hypothetical protein